MNQVIIVTMVCLLAACHGQSPKTIDRQFSAVITTAINDPTRPTEAVHRDGHRKPFEVLTFSKIRPGDEVIEITPGEGYYTALLSRMVGKQGLVYAVDPARVFEHLPRIRKFFSEYQQTDPRSNVHYTVQNLDEIHTPNPVDQIWMVLYYHDTVWTGENRLQMNRRLYDLLKPGGTLLLIDHHADTSNYRDEITRTLHRIDSSIVMTELIAAGFSFDAASDVLSNPKDPKDVSVFDAAWRGKTDRFVWRFSKSQD